MATQCTSLMIRSYILKFIIKFLVLVLGTLILMVLNLIDLVVLAFMYIYLINRVRGLYGEKKRPARS